MKNLKRLTLIADSALTKDVLDDLELAGVTRYSISEAPGNVERTHDNVVPMKHRRIETLLTEEAALPIVKRMQSRFPSNARFRAVLSDCEAAHLSEKAQEKETVNG